MGNMKRISIFLLAATLFHVWLLIIIGTKQKLPARRLGEISITVDASPSGTGSVAITRQGKGQDKNKSENNPMVANPSISIAMNERQDISSESRNVDNNRRNRVTNSERIRNQLLGRVQTRLSQYLVYPPLARQRGWEGTVDMAFDVAASGQLDNIKISQSSGHTILDQSAKKALEKVKRIRISTNWHNGSMAKMMIPIHYQLTEP